MPLNVSEFGLNMIRFISNLYGGVFLYSYQHMYAGKRCNGNPNSTKG